MTAVSNNGIVGDAANDLTGGSGATLNVVGNGVFSLSFANNYAGNWQVTSGGGLEIGNASSLGTGVTPVVITSGRLFLDDGVSLGRNLTLNNGAMVFDYGATALTGTVTVAQNVVVSLIPGFTGSVLTVGSITGGGVTSMIQTGPGGGGGTVILTQDSNYVGTWNVTGAQTLQLDADARLGAASNHVTLVGTFATTANFTSARLFTPTTGGVATIDTAAGTTLTLSTGLGAGSASLSKSGDGTLVLKAASTRTGFTLINAGVLRVENATAVGTAGGNSITVFPGATMEIAGVTLDKPFFLQSGTLRGVGTAASNGLMTVVAGHQIVLTTGASSSDVFTLGNAINDLTGGGNGSTMTVSGSGTVSLPFANNYSGDWTVNSGTLRIGNATSLGSSSTPVVINSAALEIASATLNRPLTLNNGAILRGTATASSNGTTTVAAGAAVTLATGATTSDTFSIGNAANDLTGGSGNSTITVSGLGKVVMVQNSNYTGNWTVSSGTLAVNGSITGAVAVNNGATLAGVGSVGGLATVASGGTLSPGNSPGAITLGSLTLNSGAVQDRNRRLVAWHAVRPGSHNGPIDAGGNSASAAH